jgi:3'-phosphoadenosine 5'-phosphosulfate synthase
MATKETKSSTLYTPEDDSSKEIEKQIQTHALTLHLRSNTSLTENRYYGKISGVVRSLILTTGSLLGPGKIVVPPLAFRDDDGRSLTLIFYLGASVCGYPGVVHGGLLATLLDEALMSCSCAAFPEKIAVTASLKLQFQKKAPTEKLYSLKARLLKVDGRMAWVEGWIEILRDGGNTGDDEVVVKAEGLYMAPTAKAKLRALI